MKKVLRLENLGCANCAAKMERAISKLPGVEAVAISFMTQRMTLECDEGRLSEILKQAQACISKYEPECKLLGVK